MNTREKVLKEALNCVNGEREKQYGNPEDNFKRIADLWSVYLTSIFEDVVFELDPIDVAKMMILFKIARSNGDKDKMDNYVDMIGYAACAAEIFESQAEESKVAESRSCSKKASDNIRDFFGKVAQGYSFDFESGTVTNKEEFEKCMHGVTDPYSYAHDKLANYVSTKAREEHIPLKSLKDINRKFPRELSDYLEQAATDCVINGKRFLDCYKEIDELFAKYTPDKDVYNSFWDAYRNISEHITSSSKKANVDENHIIGHLVENGNAPTKMAALLMTDKLKFDDVAAYIDDAINEVKKEGKNANNN